MTDLSYFIVEGVADGLCALLDLVKGKCSLKLFINYKSHGKEWCVQYTSKMIKSTLCKQDTAVGKSLPEDCDSAQTAMSTHIVQADH